MFSIETVRGKSVEEQRVEVVERKGLGHPDFICDSVMEAISVALSKVYLKKTGGVLHHNIDKGLLAAGRVEKRFGGGRVIKPMELIIGDRATFKAAGKTFPVEEVAVETAKGWIGKNLRFVEPDRHLKYRCVLAPGSEELSDIFARAGAVRGANDTSCAVGYYPLSKTEEAVLKLERFLNSGRFKSRHPETGEDIKVMGFRNGRGLDLTVAMPFMAELIGSEKEYFRKKEAVEADIIKYLDNFKDGFGDIRLSLNALDEKGRGTSGVYLSLLGTSAEDADSGQVGRGNRVNGLISMMRPMGTEAAAGKNPVSHVGKIYNVLAHKAAEKIYKKVGGIKEIYVILLSRIGSPVDSPLLASARVLPEGGIKTGDLSAQIRETLEEELLGVPRLCMELAVGKYAIC